MSNKEGQKSKPPHINTLLKKKKNSPYNTIKVNRLVQQPNKYLSKKKNRTTE